MRVADLLRPVVTALVGPELPVTLRCWDGSSLGSGDARTAIVLRSPNALRRLLYHPNELGLGRAYVAGELDIEGDVFEALALRDLMASPDREVEVRLRGRDRLRLIGVVRRLGALGRPLPAPPEEARLKGRLHSRSRDASAITHHYDVGNDFYRLVLGGTLTYSCAYFETPGTSLKHAQVAKYDLVCRKLGLEPGMRLLDVGCGWGGMVMHAARAYRVDAVGVTLSHAQAELAAKRVAEAGLADRIQIREQDYREISDGPYDAVASIGMFEHVGLSKLREYFSRLVELLRPRGRLLNHGISRPPGRPGFDRNSFISRYVFPDGELHEVGTVVSAMQECGFEVRDVESLREHYAGTLRRWVANLEAHWDEAVRLGGEGRARVWRLYMAGSALNFEAGRNSIHQILGVRPGPEGDSGMPPTRTALLGPPASSGT